MVIFGTDMLQYQLALYRASGELIISISEWTLFQSDRKSQLNVSQKTDTIQ